MLTKNERQLLENVLDELDGLFDNKSTAADVRALLVAAAQALQGSELSAPVEVAIGQLQQFTKSDELPDPQRDLALYLTNDLRMFVASRLQHDSMENPRRRGTGKLISGKDDPK